MKKAFGVLVALSVVLWMASAASAGTVSYTTDNLTTMSHGNYYIWNLVGLSDTGQQIQSASLSFTNLSDYATSDTLYVNLLSSAVSSAAMQSITQGPCSVNSDCFTTPTSSFSTSYPYISSVDLLDTIHNKHSTYYGNYSIDIPNTDFSYLTGQTFAIGFNPHCYFWNSGITLTVTTSPVSTPEPATLLLLGLGLAGLAIFRMKSRRALTTTS